MRPQRKDQPQSKDPYPARHLRFLRKEFSPHLWGSQPDEGKGTLSPHTLVPLASTIVPFAFPHSQA